MNGRCTPNLHEQFKGVLIDTDDLSIILSPLVLRLRQKLDAQRGLDNLGWPIDALPNPQGNNLREQNRKKSPWR